MSNIDRFSRRLRLPLFASLAAAALLGFAAVRSAAMPREIAVDTVWEGTVDAGEGVQVLKGATLLILPGTTVRFAPTKNEAGEPMARLIVRGTIIAQGTAERPITFASSSPEPRPGDWGGIALEGAVERVSRLRHVVIRNALLGLSGMHSILQVEDAVVRDNVTGVYAYQELNGWMFRGTVSGNEIGVHFYQSSAFALENCEIAGNSRAGILLALNSSPMIRHCTIADNGGSGVHLVQGASPLLEHNTIRGHQRGISLELQTRPRILRNAISGNETGIWGEKMVFPWIEGNVISGNGTGIYCNYSAYMEIHGNNLHDNRTFGLVVGDNMSILMQNKIPFRFLGQFSFEKALPGSDSAPHQARRLAPFPENAGVVDARANWWGAAATAEMEKVGENGNVSVIEDFFDKPDTYYQEEVYRRDRVAFAPWEKEPVKDAGPIAKAYSGVGGKVAVGGKPAAGVRVHAYTDAAGGFRGEGTYYSGPTASDGSFFLNIPAGTYYLVAKHTSPPFPYAEPRAGELFGYYGGNPVTVVAAESRTSNIQVTQRTAPAVTTGGDPAQARVSGVVLGPGGPVEGASVHVYADASRQFRGPDLFGPQGAVPGGTDAKGVFSFDLPPGTYYLVASKRVKGDSLGPLQSGDLHGYFDGNPLEMAAGTATALTLHVVEKLRETVSPVTAAKGGTGIRGKITDPSGKVPQGVYAFATTDPSFMIGGMPPYRSQPLGADGSYAIELPAGGTYYVSARSGYGGPPLPGEWHGFRGEKTPSPVVVESGRVVEGIDFTVKKME